ncbi:methyltransferase domain-containing protein [Falsirhodobacter halotolerans]|uniref:methyltransferase domain-containing protein n=1 Tax=Falsirhodobacter halotolerans TaxID=1146892 RepID=UPI001FD52A3E|nr:methyltransferase domain-containing protein [Falsirhodobacter halotolerans]MCJ8138663.1 methyltransferase domain-containing protein [Falsirhodobacter halotolerans]
MTWSPETYARFRGFRLRPALDLLAQVGEVPEGDVIDLGCGSGAVAGALATLARPLIGVDMSAEMLAQAPGYDRLVQADIASWQPETPPALIFSNAALHWLGDHATLMPRLAAMLPRTGVLAVQMPGQDAAPSHRLIADTAQALWPNRFPPPPIKVQPAEWYADLLMPFGSVTAWETRYVQHLEPVASGHPVRHFTEGAAMVPWLAVLTTDERGQLIAAYDTALATPYSLRPDGSVLFPFRRVFFVLRRD